MKMNAESRAIDKIYKRRDRYDIPDWQRDEVWDRPKKQNLIDSILRGWRLPKFYFVKTSEDSYLIEDGQQRLAAIYEFFSNDLPLSAATQTTFGGPLYRDLKPRISDAFDDFEIDFDVIEDATDEDLKDFFQRLQEGMGLNSSEKLNAVHSKLRDYCKKLAKHTFFKEIIAIPDTRYAHFDIAAKVATIEIEGPDTGLRLDDVKGVFQSNSNFSPTSAVAKRITAALDLLAAGFKKKSSSLRTRTIVQSFITLACKLVGTGKTAGREKEVHAFFTEFMTRLTAEVELGQAATDSDYVAFQTSVSANVKGSARTRQEILLRKLFQLAPSLAAIFDPSVVAETGIPSRLSGLSESMLTLIDQLNKRHAAKMGEDLFKATNKTAQAMARLRKPVSSVETFNTLIDDLYFLFKESTGSRLADVPEPFRHVNVLRTELRHDVDHGDASAIKSKRRKAGTVFAQYAGDGTPETVEADRLALAQVNLLTAIEGALRGLLLQ
jgi:Protein of unknown function DUF262